MLKCYSKKKAIKKTATRLIFCSVCAQAKSDTSMHQRGHNAKQTLAFALALPHCCAPALIFILSVGAAVAMLLHP